MTVVFFVLFAMLSLAPGRDHAENATAIASVVLSEPPLFRDDEDRMKTAALVTAVAFRESSFRNGAKSKTGDHCLMQVQGRPDLRDDVEKCVRVALSMLRESFHACPAFPLAVYAAGAGACEDARAQRISRDRMALARRLGTEGR
jgi:membrane-bound lytic murein transglycosylase MltF